MNAWKTTFFIWISIISINGIRKSGQENLMFTLTFEKSNVTSLLAYYNRDNRMSFKIPLPCFCSSDSASCHFYISYLGSIKNFGSTKSRFWFFTYSFCLFFWELFNNQFLSKLCTNHYCCVRKDLYLYFEVIFTSALLKEHFPFSDLPKSIKLKVVIQKKKNVCIFLSRIFAQRFSFPSCS